MNRIASHPSTLAVFSGLLGAVIGFLVNLASGGKKSQLLWIGLIFAILISLGIAAWQEYSQEKTGKQWMMMLQEMVFQTYFLALVTDKPEVSQLARQRLGQVLRALTGEQQLSMLLFFSRNGLSATFIGDALRGSTGLAGADLQHVELPQINLEQADLSRAKLTEANLREANLRDTVLSRADLSGADLSQASLSEADLTGVILRGANLTGADLSNSTMEVRSGGRDAPRLQVGSRRYPVLRADLSQALLSGAKVREANLVGADLAGAQLRDVDLTGANLSYANLQGVDFSGATLTGAALMNANLQEADLTGATLKAAILDEADMRAAKVTEDQLQAALSRKNLKLEA
jgi:uncharacterized protein YjbI with pentapeptide repeats